MGLDDEYRRRLENEIADNPQIGVVMRGTGGLRKMRFALKNKGKSAGARALYVDYVFIQCVYLITAYPKNQREDITLEEREMFKKIIEQTKRELGGKQDE